MVQCASPLKRVSERGGASQRLDPPAAVPLEAPVVLSDTVQIGSSLSAAALQHSVTAPASTSVSQASSPRSQSSLHAAVSPGEAAAVSCDRAPSGTAHSGGTLSPRATPLHRAYGDLAKFGCLEPTMFPRPAAPHPDTAAPVLNKHQWHSAGSAEEALTSPRPPSEQPEEQAAASEDVERNHSGIHPLGGSLPNSEMQDLQEFRGMCSHAALSPLQITVKQECQSHVRDCDGSTH